MNKNNEIVITAHQAHMRIVDILDYFYETSRKPENQYKKLMAEIDNVSFYDIFVLYKRIQGEDKKIFLPHELDTDCITIVFRPAKGCVIYIESVPAETFKAKKLKLYNQN